MTLACMTDGVLSARIETIRRFNRLYTSRIGLLAKNHLGTRYSLTESRLLYEIGQQECTTAKALCDRLMLDQGYVSRLLAQFQKDGLIGRRASAEDGRVQHIALTKAGRKTYAMLDAKAGEAVAALLHGKPEAEQRDLTAATETLLRSLGDTQHSPVVIRPPAAGDIGWIVHRHGTVIAAEFGWDRHFETTIAQILGQFGTCPGREAGFIAERDGQILGSIFVMPDGKDVARLRVLYVEPAARGLGLGKQLVELAVQFARDAGYRKAVLWTHEFQKSARQIYAAAGFRLTKAEKARSFGVDVVSETWECSL